MRELTVRACEAKRKRLLAVPLVLFLLVGGSALRAQTPQVDPVATGQTRPGESHQAAGPVEEEHAGRGIVDVIARLVNFAILAGTLTYLLKSPIAGYLDERRGQIRGDLVNAREMRDTASAQMADIDRRMQSLPGELEALRRQGVDDIAAEEARIRAAAAVERDRLLEHARREIDLQVKIAERDLVAHAADLAVGVAAERIRKTIDDADQKRLVDRYVSQLKG